MFGSKTSNGPLFPLELFNGNTFNTINWNTDSQNQITIIQSVVGPTKIKGYGSGQNETTVEVEAPEDSEICIGESVNLTAENPDNASISWNHNITDGQDFTPTSTNTYTVTASIGDCSVSDEVEIIVHDLPQIDFHSEPTEGCENVNAEFENLTSGNYSYQWEFENGENSNVENPTIYFDEVGTYDVFVTVTSQYGCVDSLIKENYITVYENPEVDFSADNTEGCDNLVTDFSVNSTGNNLTYEWDFGDNSSLTNEENPTHEYVSTGEYDVTLTITNDNNCTVSLTLENYIKVHASPNIDFQASDTLSCDYLDVTFENLTNNSQKCHWDFGDGTTSDECGSVSHEYSEIGGYDVILIVENEWGCIDSLNKTNYIQIVAGPNAAFTASETELYLPNYQVDFENESENATNYNWNFGDGTTSSNEHENHNFPNDEPGTYHIELIASNEIGCTDTANTTITIVYAKPEYSIPNIFTPNNDGDNDAFKLITYENLLNVEVVILNRWGNEVFTSENDLDFKWNGKIHNSGVECSEGVYFYKMIFTGLDLNEHQATGFIHLVRK